MFQIRAFALADPLCYNFCTVGLATTPQIGDNIDRIQVDKTN